MTTYFFVAASEKFLTVEEPLDEILKERMRNYKENNKEIDFWLLKNPSFLQTTQFADLKAKIPNISQDKFNELAEDAKLNCPVSGVLNCDIILSPTLL